MGDPIRVEVERSSFRVGDVVRGTVYVDQDLERCTSFDAYLEYGGKRVATTQVGRTTLVPGPVRQGQSFGFALTIPSHAPFSFGGHAHRVQWSVVARADGSWAIDAKGKEAIEVLPAVVEPSPEAIDAVSRAHAPAPEAASKLVVTLLAALVGVVLVVAGLVLLPLVLFFAAKQRIINTRLGDFKVTVPDRAFVLGEWVPVTLRFRLKLWEGMVPGVWVGMVGIVSLLFGLLGFALKLFR